MNKTRRYLIMLCVILISLLLTSCAGAIFKGARGDYGPPRPVTPEEETQSYVFGFSLILVIIALEIIRRISTLTQVIVSIIALIMAVCFLAA